MRLASTAILVRESAVGAQALLVRRHAQLGFMGGAWVFPGGKVDEVDRSAPAIARCRGTPEGSLPHFRDYMGRSLDEAEVLGFLVAACREIFEEAGLLVLRGQDGRSLDAAAVALLQAERGHIVRDASRFVALMEREDLWLHAGDFLHWANWITPSAAPQRFDTRFFVVAMPEGQSPEADQAETSDIQWIDLHPGAELPDERVVSAPPTRSTLADLLASLAELPTLDALFAREARRDIAPVMPKMTKSGEQLVAVMPWDPQYESLPGEGVAAPASGYPQRLARLPSRVIARHEIKPPRTGG